MWRRYLVLMVCLFIGHQCYTQTSSLRIPLIIHDSLNANHPDTIYFGLDTRATFCVDPELGERSLADPCGPPGAADWCYLFQNPDGPGANGCEYFTNRLDLRPITGRLQTDRTVVQGVIPCPPVVDKLKGEEG